MIPSLNLSQLNQKNEKSPNVPSLNLSFTNNSPSISPLNLNTETNQISDKKTSQKSDSIQIPSLQLNKVIPPSDPNQKHAPRLGNLNLSELNLVNLPPASYKEESHEVIICIPYKEFTTSQNPILSQPKYDEFSIFQTKLNKLFGEQANLTQVSSVPPQFVVNQDQISLSDIDSAFQNTEHLTPMINECNQEIIQLTRDIDEKITDINRLEKMKEQLLVKIEVMKSQINSNKEQVKLINSMVQNSHSI